MFTSPGVFTEGVILLHFWVGGLVAGNLNAVGVEAVFRESLVAWEGVEALGTGGA